MKIEWIDIEETASEIFSIWVDQPELRWAEKAWSVLDKSGLTFYENDLDLHLVLIRLLAIGTLYHEFCELAFDQTASIDYLGWMGHLGQEGWGLSFFRLGQLLGPGYSPELKLHQVDDDEYLEEFVKALIGDQREIITPALIDGFGGESLFFAYLWLSRQIVDEDEVENDEVDDESFYDYQHTETIFDVLNDVSADKMRAYEWIQEGMFPIYGYSYKIAQKEKLEQLIKAGETTRTEFKQYLFVDAKGNKKSAKDLKSFFKNIAAFINTEGGKILIGVGDDQSIYGIESEYVVTNPQKANRDGFYLKLVEMIKENIEHYLLHRLVKARFHFISGREICEVNVSKTHDYSGSHSDEVQ